MTRSTGGSARIANPAAFDWPGWSYGRGDIFGDSERPHGLQHSRYPLFLLIGAVVCVLGGFMGWR